VPQEELETLKKIEALLDERVRPLLWHHGGNVVVQSFQDGVLAVRMTGACAGCPSAVSEIEEIAGAAVKEKIPGVRDVFVATGVSDELLDAARKILGKKRERNL